MNDRVLAYIAASTLATYYILSAAEYILVFTRVISTAAGITAKWAAVFVVLSFINAALQLILFIAAKQRDKFKLNLWFYFSLVFGVPYHIILVTFFFFTVHWIRLILDLASLAFLAYCMVRMRFYYNELELDQLHSPLINAHAQPRYLYT